MSATYIGYADGLLTETSYSVSRDGVAKYIEKIVAKVGSSYTAPSIGDAKTIDSQSLSVVNVSISAQSGNFTEYSIQYEGRASGSTAPTATTVVQSSLTGATGEEPIASNYNFIVSHDNSNSIVEFSGGAVTQGNASTTGGALFSTDGEFIGFTKYAKRNLFGVQSYLNPNISFSRSFTTQTRPDLSAVGRIMSGTSGFPTLQTGKNWLCASITYRKQGTTYSVTQEFRASDRNGWNTYIYGPAVSVPSAT
jgi:hypothetical protein